MDGTDRITPADLTAAERADPDALARILDAATPTLRALITAGFPQRHAATLSIDDILQQTYVDAFDALPRLCRALTRDAADAPPADDTLTRYLSTIARRNLVDAARMLDAEKRGGRGRRGAAPIKSPHATLLTQLAGPRSNSPTHAVTADEALAALKRAIGNLPPDYRTVIEQYDLALRPMDEVAAAIGRSRGAAFMIRARALRLLRRSLGSAANFLSQSA